MATPKDLLDEAAVLENEAIEFLKQKLTLSAQVRIQQAKSKRDEAAFMRQQAGEIAGSIGPLGCCW